MKYISKFLGIKVRVELNATNENRIKAEYGNQSAVITMNDLRIIEGRLPKKVTEIVINWAFENRDAIEENIRGIKSNEPIKKIITYL